MNCYIGIELLGSRKGFTIAVLDPGLRIVFQSLVTPLEWQGIVGGARSVIAAVNSPLTLNQGFMAEGDFRQQHNLTVKTSRLKEMRVCEFELICQGLSCARTPRDVGKFSKSLQKAFKFTSDLGMNGFQFWPSVNAERQMLETQADACFWSMLGVVPFPAGSLEGRIQRQLALQAAGLLVPDAMEFFEEVTRHRLLSGKLPVEKLLTTPDLNALAAAYTAWVVGNRPAEYTRIGEPDEGVIILPAPSLPVSI